MSKKITPLLVEKYNITNKILKEFADLESRHILFSIIKKPKTVQEISKDLKIPLSSAYRKIQNLMQASLILVEKKFTSDGQIIRYYQSKIEEAQISISKFEPSISLDKNLKVKK
jgi:predicted transcriptional regulator